MSDLKKLVFKAAGQYAGRLVFKASGQYAGRLCYKAASGQPTIISFAWGEEAKDLDICAYWLGAKTSSTDRTGYVGYGWNYNPAGTYQVYSKTVDGVVYNIGYWGDERNTSNSERIRVWKTPWSAGNNTLRVHLNFYGWGSTYPDTSCEVIASQPGGQTLICAGRTNPKSGKAFDTDPYVDVTFSTDGILQSMTFHDVIGA